MRTAPPVQVALDDGRRERMLITSLHGLAGGVLAGWAGAHGQWPVGAAVVAALVAAASMAALGTWLARRALSQPAGQLQWTGQAWQWLAPAPAPLRRVVVAIDLGSWTLLQLHPADGSRPRWGCASAAAAGAGWHGLRVALAVHAGAAAPAPAGPAP